MQSESAFKPPAPIGTPVRASRPSWHVHGHSFEMEKPTGEKRAALHESLLNPARIAASLSLLVLTTVALFCGLGPRKGSPLRPCQALGSCHADGLPPWSAAAERWPLSQCLPLLHAGRWSNSSTHRCTSRSAMCGMNHTWDWLSQDCGQQRLGKRAIQELLRNKTVVISGDSHVRKLYNQFARALGLVQIDEEGPSKWADMRQQHNDTGTVLHFLWNGYITEQERIFSMWASGELQLPDILIADGMAWHARFEKNVAGYTKQLQKFTKQMKRVRKAFRQAGRAPLLVWVEAPVPSKEMNSYWGEVEDDMRRFNSVAKQLKLAGRPGAPFHLLDLAAIMDGCGSWCREADGHHAAQEVNSLLFQLAMNMWQYHVQYQSALSARRAQEAALAAAALNSSSISIAAQALNASASGAQGPGLAAAPAAANFSRAAANFSALVTEVLKLDARPSPSAGAKAPAFAPAPAPNRQASQGSSPRPKPTLAQIFPPGRMVRVPRRP